MISYSKSTARSVNWTLNRATWVRFTDGARYIRCDWSWNIRSFALYFYSGKKRTSLHKWKHLVLVKLFDTLSRKKCALVHLKWYSVVFRRVTYKHSPPYHNHHLYYKHLILVKRLTIPQKCFILISQKLLNFGIVYQKLLIGHYLNHLFHVLLFEYQYFVLEVKILLHLHFASFMTYYFTFIATFVR
jgi:hypothetical protein